MNPHAEAALHVTIEHEAPTTLRLLFDHPLDYGTARALRIDLEALPGVELVALGRYIVHVHLAAHVATLVGTAALIEGQLAGDPADRLADLGPEVEVTLNPRAIADYEVQVRAVGAGL